MNKPHILPHSTLLYVINSSWKTLWTTKVGRRPLHAFTIDAQVVGKFFQEIMTHELHVHDPEMWMDPSKPRSPKLPDFVCTNPAYSFELKMCSQRGSRHVFGNRCSSQGYASPNGKSRDGWMLTINYTDTRINLIRFGYIHGSDWIGQPSASGNSAWLHPNVYASKLQVVHGPYQFLADPMVLKGVGARTRYTTVGEALDAGNAQAKAFINSDFYM